MRRGLSAGRVQSGALRIICEREREIQAFKSREYWNLTAQLEGEDPPAVTGKLVTKDGRKIEPANQQEVEAVLSDVGWRIVETTPVEDGRAGAVTVRAEREPGARVEFKVGSVQAREKKKNPLPPFITSKLQQDAARQLGFSVTKTMRVAQGLYEGRAIGDAGTVGLITYMRTDSTRVSDEALSAVRDYIGSTYGAEALPDEPRVFKVGKRAQEAHEAIRPTYLEYSPDAVKDQLGRDEFRLYQLIWTRFVASQMKSALFDVTRVDVEAGPYIFRATGSVLKFAGWLAVYHEGKDEDARPTDADEEQDNEVRASAR